MRELLFINNKKLRAEVIILFINNNESCNKTEIKLKKTFINKNKASNIHIFLIIMI